MGPAPLADHAHRTPPRGDLSAPVAAHRFRARAAVGAPVQRADEGRPQGEEPETAQTRKIAPDEHTVKLLTEHRDMWAQRCDDLGAVLTLDAFVFSNHPDGSQPYAPRAINQRYRKLALKLKLRSTRLHSLRHYSATELVAAGVDIRTVAVGSATAAEARQPSRSTPPGSTRWTTEPPGPWPRSSRSPRRRPRGPAAPRPLRDHCIGTARADPVRPAQARRPAAHRRRTRHREHGGGRDSSPSDHRPQGRGLDRGGARATRCGPRVRTRDRSGVKLTGCVDHKLYQDP